MTGECAYHHVCYTHKSNTMEQKHQSNESVKERTVCHNLIQCFKFYFHHLYRFLHEIHNRIDLLFAVSTFPLKMKDLCFSANGKQDPIQSDFFLFFVKSKYYSSLQFVFLFSDASTNYNSAHTKCHLMV